MEMKNKSNYGTFFAMIGTSTLVMFGLMYLNSYEFGHVRFSETRTFMAIYMGAAMAIIMLLFMLGMYKMTVALWNNKCLPNNLYRDHFRVD